eukprot:scaffold54853_cov58-Phaeocystis_antarctica.AAC.5
MHAHPAASQGQHPPARRPQRPAVGRGQGPTEHRGAHPSARTAAAPPCLGCRPSGRWRRRSELSRVAAPRDPHVGAPRRAAEGGQVAGQGRAGGRALHWFGPRRSGRDRNPAAYRRNLRPPGDGEGATEVRRQRRLAK